MTEKDAIELGRLVRRGIGKRIGENEVVVDANIFLRSSKTPRHFKGMTIYSLDHLLEIEYMKLLGRPVSRRDLFLLWFLSAQLYRNIKEFNHTRKKPEISDPKMYLSSPCYTGCIWSNDELKNQEFVKSSPQKSCRTTKHDCQPPCQQPHW